MKEKGLTGFQLKIIGLILMVFDHVYAFLNYNDIMPIAFRWVGRIVAPIFIFMIIEGYTHTRSKKKYMLRLYLGSLFMNVGNFVLGKYLPRADNIALMNNIFATLFLITVYLCITDFITKAIEEKRKPNILLGTLLLLVPVILNILIIIGASSGNMIWIYSTFILPTPLFVEGGPVLIIIGIIMYLLRENRKKLITVYSLLSLALIFTGELSMSGIFMYNYQWMMVFAAPFMYLYNGEKGRGMKHLFYIFYPAHIYILYIASTFMINK